MSTPFLRSGDRILFIGDSITDAFRKPEEINDAYQMGNGYGFLIASKLRAQRPRDALSFFNRGISGNGVLDLAARWDEDCLRLAPDVISILVGVNETIRHFHQGSEKALTPDEFEAAYAALLEHTRATLPKVRLILCEPFLLPCGLVTRDWQIDVGARAQSVRRLAQECGAISLPLQDIFDGALRDALPEYWAYDGIHPTAAGHHLLAQAWLDAVQL